jgi:hypothetical protein
MRSMPATQRRRLRFWLVAPLLVLGLSFGIDAVYGQPGRRPGNPGSNLANPPGVLPGIQPSGPGFPPGFPGGGNPVQPVNPGLPSNPPGFPNNPPGFPNNPSGVGVQKTCTCSKCGATFNVVGDATPTHCAACGVKFDVVYGDTGPKFPNGGAGGLPNGNIPVTAPPGGPNGMTPPGMPSPNGWNPPATPPAYNPNNYNSNPSSSSRSGDDGTNSGFATGFAILVGIGIFVLGILLIGGVALFIVIARMMETKGSGAGRAGPRRRRTYDA